jgi:hypothetical protein
MTDEETGRTYDRAEGLRVQIHTMAPRDAQAFCNFRATAERWCSAAVQANEGLRGDRGVACIGSLCFP